jgi:beta-galactosidase
MQLGVCYYPEHWPQTWWADDAQRMRAMGITWVRIAEFAWSRIEPTPGVFDWAWLDEAIDTLHAQGLKVVMCTPTATPPKWLVDAMPDLLAIDAHGQPRGFGSRRHYCFSHAGYRAESRRISRAVAERYGQHPAVAAWQTDNEYGCHDTVLSYSAAAEAGFRRWLQASYGDIATLNTAWGTVFWSMEYRSFDEIDAPVGTVTEAHPAHRLDWRRFASDEVRAFNREQVEILRELSPARPVSHNFMGFFTEFDHHAVSADLDIATWDSYPLGFTQNFFLSADEKARYARVGHPDIPSFHHDLYRGMCASVRPDAPAHGRWWVMEQQPGPVNWASWNPAPHDGMVRLWTWQAFAHGAEVVSYFRWRQAPFAQEQMHTGLHRPDRSVDQGGVEAAQVGAELQALAAQVDLAAQGIVNRVALVFDYDSLWMAQIQPQGADYNPLELQFRVYSALRQLGLDVDIVGPNAVLTSYALIVLPVQLHASAALVDALTQAAATGAQIVLGPRAGAKTEVLAMPENLAPGALSALAGVQVLRVASLPPGVQALLHFNGDGDTAATASAQRWREDLALNGAQAEARFDDDGRAAITRQGSVRYVAGWLDASGWQQLLVRAATDAGLAPQPLPADLRVSRIGALLLACNFSDRTLAYTPASALPSTSTEPLMGSATLAPRGIALWPTAQSRPGAEPATAASA